MARGQKKGFQDLAKERYDKLDGEIENLELQIKALKEEQKSIRSYLQAAGVIEKPKRGPRKKNQPRS